MVKQEGPDVGSFNVDFNNVLTDTIQKILIVEERIEEKLDAVLAKRRSFITPSRNQMQEMSIESAHSGVINAYHSNESLLREPNRTLMWEEDVRMRSIFQLLIDEYSYDTVDNMDLTEMFRVQSRGPDHCASGTSRFVHYIQINPNSTFLKVWFVIVLLVLVAQLTYVPYAMAWNIDFGVTHLFIVVFWTLDAAISFLTLTYNAEGEQNPIGVSAREYALSWFPLDLVIVLIEWIGLFPLYTSTGNKWRLITILRISKLDRYVNRVKDMAPLANESHMLFRVCYFCVSFLWFFHVLACSWFLIGKFGLTGTRERWLEVPISMPGGRMIDISEQEKQFQYLICFHWSVATFTLGGMEVGYANMFERIFGVAFTVVSFLFGSVIISLLSTIFLENRSARRDITVKLRILYHFLRENQVSNMLALRIQKVCLERLKMKEPLAFSDTIAVDLPASLYKDLRYEIIGRCLRKHDLFNHWSLMDMSVAKEYSADGVGMNFLKVGDELFRAKVCAERCYFFSSGALTYSKITHQPGTTALVPQGTWLSEAALWSQWVHVGTCEATAGCKCLSASYDKLAEHIRGHRVLRAITLSYCKLFCRGLASAKPPTGNFADDMCVPLTKFAGMLMHFPKELRTIIGAHSIKISKLGKKSAAKLMVEIDEGKCVAYMSIEGALERTVLVTVLMLQSPEGHALFQVGKVVPNIIVNEDGEETRHWESQPELQLPGVKHAGGEFLSDTLKRLVDKKLKLLKNKLEHISTLFEEEVAFSKEFGLKTRYLFTKIICSVRGDFPLTCVCDETNLAGTSPQKLPSSGSQASTAHIARVSLYVAFEGDKHLIYAWLSRELEDTLKRSTQHRRDEMLNQILSRVNFGIIEKGPRGVLKEQAIDHLAM